MTKPVAGMFVRWTDQDGKLSEPASVALSLATREESLEALKALVPEGCRASIIGFRLGQVDNIFFTEQPGFDALQLMEMDIANHPGPATLYTT